MDEKKPNPWPDLLKAWRKERRWSQERAAAVVGVSYSTWTKWEQGVVQPSSIAAALISERCGIRISEPQIA